jgi:multiple sugar transport system ATP-binding protein
MIFVTHDQVEAMTMGDRVVVLKDGVIQQAADPDTLYRNPANAFVAAFIGSPGMNLFPGRITEVTGGCAFVHPLFAWKLPDPVRSRVTGYQGRDIIFGVRPEDIGSTEAWRLEGAPRLKAVIGVVERLGGQACLYLQAEAHEGLITTSVNPGEIAFAARPDGAAGWQAGQALELPIDARKASFFDPASGFAIS